MREGAADGDGAGGGGGWWRVEESGGLESDRSAGGSQFTVGLVYVTFRIVKRSTQVYRENVVAGWWYPS